MFQKAKPFFFASLLAFGAACGDTSSSPTDANTRDTGAPGADTGTPGSDAGVDAAGPVADGGADAAVPLDTGAVPQDSGILADSQVPGDAGDTNDASSDAGVDAALPRDTGPDAACNLVDAGNYLDDAGTGGPAPLFPSISPDGHDRFYALTHDAAGNIYITGQVADSTSATADFSLMVVKLDSTGALDMTFGGGDGVATANVTPMGRANEVARSIVIQSTGRIVIAGTAEHDPSVTGPLATDTDIVLVGFEPDGDLDMSFGDMGVRRVDVNTGVVGESMGQPALVGGDSQWGLALLPGDALAVHGTARAAGTRDDGMGVQVPRTDADWVVVRLDADGDVDTTFGDLGTGWVTLDIGMANASARGITALPDGSMIAAGYTTSGALFAPGTPGNPTTQQPVLFKLEPDGDLDPTFATMDAFDDVDGVWHDFAVPHPYRAEAYGAAPQQDGSFVTIGYGPSLNPCGSGTDFISLRYSPAGEIDRTYGMSMGATYVDIAGLGDNGRGLTTLPDDRIIAVGVGRTPRDGNTNEQDAVVLILDDSGIPDTTFAPRGFRTYDLGLADQFWGADVAPAGDRVVIVGVAGAEMGGDDDGAVLILPLS